MTDEPVHLVEREETGDRFLIYTDNRGIRVELRYEGEALWMTQAQMASLFGRDVSVISRHIASVIEEGELSEESSLQKVQTTSPGRPSALYSLDMVISVGYRVSSAQATLFRKWATGVLVQFATRGFVVDVERLKQPGQQDRIAELREIIRDIRSSEANMYAELRDICAMCQDYDPSSDQSRRFFKETQAKLFYAVTNRTPADIVGSRSDAQEPNMGLQSWAKAEITKADVTVAKNYLGPSEIKELNRLTTIMLDIFDDQLNIGRLTTMAEATALLEKQLLGLSRLILNHGGNISGDQAKARAIREYDRFNAERKAQKLEVAKRELAALKTADKALGRVRTPRAPKA